MTHEEWTAWKKQESEFLSHPAGKAFNKFRNAALALDQNDATTSDRTLAQRDREFNDASLALKAEIRKLICAQPSPTEQPDATHA